MKSMIAWTLAAGVAALAGCRSSDHEREEAAIPVASSGAGIEGVDWALVDVAGEPAMPTPQGGRPAFILLQEGRMTGYSGVNNLSGGYRIDGTGLQFNPVAMTRRAGTPEAMRQEGLLSQALLSTASYRRSNGTLRLLDSEGKALTTFRAEPTSP